MTHDTATTEAFLNALTGRDGGLEMRVCVMRGSDGQMVLVPSAGERGDGTPVGFRRHQFHIKGDRILLVPPRQAA